MSVNKSVNGTPEQSAPPRRPPHRIVVTPAARRALDAASRLFYEHGINAVGVDRIAAEAGVTKKTLYDRFGSKEQIVVEYLAARDERWRALLDEGLAAAPPSPAEHVLAVFDASRTWSEANGSRGCAMVNAHAEIDDPEHPAYALITGQKAWLLELFTSLAREFLAPGDATPSETADRLARTLMLLHEGALVAHGLGIFPDALGQARDQARVVLGSYA
ncbi:TetR/AcrR family transcriptional regulator [Streptomyces sp. PSRA5]|uniref:TetR/AcrR family transcriptional regulator n=1 Tax=Streptomyces panacea TaxID=3035064 RepID=UPI00339BD166